MPTEDPTASMHDGDSSPHTAPSSSAEGRFAPGDVLAERYRVVSLLGRGGMGEVYRADDLTLGQSVALKFLPGAVVADPVRLERLKSEVRLARQVSHPSVCRVYDIGEADGLHYIAMEYVDGEDLSDLLRRIGRVPGDRAIQMARQLCSGLAAAHDMGIVHRDLKPANVMIDGRGRARIMDFGVAALADDLAGSQPGFAGTPAYMAPEQRARRAVTKQSDVYSLGLVLYELFTGHRAIEDDALAQVDKSGSTIDPSTPSSIVSEIDPAVERLIMRCLEEEPADRPQGALRVMAGLPGGDPLQSMLDAGETPSPELIAASGRTGSLTKLQGLLLALVFVSCVCVWLWTAVRAPTSVEAQRILGPDVLEHRAREIVRDLGYSEGIIAEARGYGTLFYPIDRSAPSESVRRAIEDDTSARVCFWYRASQGHMFPMRSTVPGGWLGEVVTVYDPPMTEPGMIGAQLSPQGRLLWFKAVRDPAKSAEQSDGSEPRWDEMLDAVGFEGFELEPADPLLFPRTEWDTRRAWTAHKPDTDWQPVRIEAASLGDRVTSFSVSDAADPLSPESLPRGDSRGNIFSSTRLITLIGFVLGGTLAVYNLRRGRGDKKGAARLFVVFLILGMIGWLMSTSHTADFELESALFISGMSYAVTRAGLACLIYLGIEPLIRRAFPRALVGWSRLLMGRWRDPLVGRDILLGVSVMGLFILIGLMTETLFGTPRIDPAMRSLHPWVTISFMIRAPMISLAATLAILLVFVIIKLILPRPRWLAPVTMVLVAFLFYGVLNRIPHESLLQSGTNVILGASLIVLLLYRGGLLPACLTFLFLSLLPSHPVSLDPDDWYAPTTYAALTIVGSACAFGFVVATAGQPWTRRSAIPSAS